LKQIKQPCKQLSFAQLHAPSKSFGGELLQGKRKSMRPLSSKHPHHLILKSTEALKNGGFFLHRKELEKEIARAAEKWGIKIHQQAICGNHLHFILRFCDRSAYRAFIRHLTGVIARKLKIKWDHRPFTRIVNWGKDFQKACRYVHQNFKESVGLIPYEPRRLHQPRRSREHSLSDKLLSPQQLRGLRSFRRQRKSAHQHLFSRTPRDEELLKIILRENNKSTGLPLFDS
jgi:REP element-mobilizing transposase RayT